MENFEQVKLNALLPENGSLDVTPLLPLADAARRDARRKTILIGAGAIALVPVVWSLLMDRLELFLAFLVPAFLLFTAAYLLLGLRREEEIAALTLNTLENLRRVTPDKIQRSLVQKLFADAIRRAAKNRLGLKRGARPYTPQEKPGWKIVDFRRLLDLRATARTNRGDREAGLYQVVVALGCSFGAVAMTLICALPLNGDEMLTWILFGIWALVAIGLYVSLNRLYWLSLAALFAYGLDCEKDSFYQAWNRADHLHALLGRSDAEQKEGEGGTGSSRRRRRGGRGKKKADGQTKGEAQPKKNGEPAKK